MKITVNGTSTELADGATVHDLVAQTHGVRRGVAVAVAGEVVPRSMWSKAVLVGGDRVEILVAVQGG